MAEYNEQELKAHIKSGNFSNAYFIYGDEPYLKNFYLSKIISSTVDPAFESFNLHMHEGDKIDIEDAFKDAEMLPMMSEYNLVVVRDFPADKTKASAEAIKEYISDLPESTIFILAFIEYTPENKSKYLQILEKAFNSAGVVVKMQKRTESDVVKLLISGAKKRNTLLTQSNARYLISVCGNDLKTLLNELDKLCSFVNGEEITKEVIDNMATRSFEARIYDISSAVSRNDAKRAYDILNYLLDNKIKANDILSEICSTFVTSYRVKCAKTAGQAYNDVGNYFNYRGRDFLLRNANRDSSVYSENQLRRAIDICIDADIQLKSTSINEKIVLEEVIAKLLLNSVEVLYA